MAPKKQEEPSKFFKGEFSFVNKDANNITSKDHNAAVSWHVMNRYERWKKQEQARKLRASVNAPLGRLTPAGHGRQSSTESFAFDSWSADRPLQAGYTEQGPSLSTGSGAAFPSATSTPSTSSSLLEDPFAPHASMWSTSHTSLEAAAVADTNEVDSLPNNVLINKLIAFAYEHIVANSWPAETGIIQGTWEYIRSLEDLTTMAEDACFSNAYLALLATAMSDINNDQELALQGRHFQDQAMIVLRERVGRQNAQDLSTHKALLKLFNTETIVDNTAMARVHLKMLRNLIASGGGIILLDSWFREDLLSADCYFALKYGTRPLLPAQEWTPGSLSQPWKARLIAAGLYGDHGPVVEPSVKDSLLRATLTDLRELFKAHEYIKTHELPADDQLLRWAQLRKFDCISRLADYLTNVSIYPHLYDKPKLQALTTTAAALMANMVLGSPEPVRFGLKLLDDLKTKFRNSESEAIDEYPQLRLWVAYVGSLAEKIHPVAGSEANFFGMATKSLVRELKLENWDMMKEILRQFLFSDKLHQEVESGVLYREQDFMRGLYSACGTSWRKPL